MGNKSGYGQYCPLAMSSEILCNRWTMLVIRELIAGSTQFNEIRRGVPLMSRTLLSARLKSLESMGLVTRSVTENGKRIRYQLTKAGRALEPIVSAMASWGQQWIEVEPSVEIVDTDFLMWDIKRNVRPMQYFPDRFVVQFHFPDAPLKKKLHWLVFEKKEIDLCYVDPGYEVDVEIETGMQTMVKIWMGWMDFDKAISDGDLMINGPHKYTKNAKDWLGLSSFSHVKKQPKEMRVYKTRLT